MAFKEDWSFLDKITMGAVGIKSVIRQLNANGHHIIELERYCTSNKIWSTKIKRLRIPDLLCLRCGKRIESRAKSKLGIIMSDAENNPDRRWFSGLRENDLVAFIQCYRNESDFWEASDFVNLFRVGDMLATENQTRLSAPKSVFEGAERDRTWKSYTPSVGFTVAALEEEKNGTRIRLVTDSGRRQSKLVGDDHFIYVKLNDTFPGNEKIVSGIVPSLGNVECSSEQYDFYSDLNSDQNEIKYTAVKALGFLPPTEKVIQKLQEIASDNVTDNRIRLEAYASLLRLGFDVWDEIHNFAFWSEDQEIKMEYVLILGELGLPNIVAPLMNIIDDRGNDAELRAAAIWSLPAQPEALTGIINQCFSEDDIVTNHAISKIENNFSSELTSPILSTFGDNEYHNAICAHILSNSHHVDCATVVKQYVSEDNPNIRNWILISIGLSGSSHYDELINELDPDSNLTKNRLVLLWEYLPKLLTDEKNDEIEFIKIQG